MEPLHQILVNIISRAFPFLEGDLHILYNLLILTPADKTVGNIIWNVLNLKTGTSVSSREEYWQKTIGNVAGFSNQRTLIILNHSEETWENSSPLLSGFDPRDLFFVLLKFILKRRIYRVLDNIMETFKNSKQIYFYMVFLLQLFHNIELCSASFFQSLRKLGSQDGH